MSNITLQKKEQTGQSDDEHSIRTLQYKNTYEEVLNEMNLLEQQGCKLNKEELRIEASLNLHARVIHDCRIELESEVICVGKECKGTIRDLRQIVTYLKGNENQSNCPCGVVVI